MSSPTHVRRHVRASLVSLLLGTTVALHRPLPVMRRSSAIQACANTEAFLDARSVEHSDFETSEEALRSARTAFAASSRVEIERQRRDLQPEIANQFWRQC